MGKIVLLSTVIILLNACEQEDRVLYPELAANLKTSIQSRITNANLSITVDSLKILRIDTITSKRKVEMQLEKLAGEFYDITTEMEEKKRQAEWELRMMQLTRKLSKKLFESSKTEGMSKTMELREMSEKMAQLIHKEDSLRMLLSTAHANDCAALQAVYFYQFSRNSKIVRRDTGYHYLYCNYKLQTNEDFMKY